MATFLFPLSRPQSDVGSTFHDANFYSHFVFFVFIDCILLLGFSFTCIERDHVYLLLLSL